MKLCNKFADTPWGPLQLEQRGKDNFRVTYGKEVKDRLSYRDAAAAYGQAIMHWLACEDQLDNRHKGER